MKNKKGNVAVFAIIVVVVAITAGIIGWMFAKKSQLTTQQQAVALQQLAKSSQQPATQPTPEGPIIQDKSDDVSKIKTSCAEAQEALEGMWVDTQDKYIKIDLENYPTNVADACKFNDKSTIGGAVVPLLKSEDKITWTKADEWNGDNYDFYRFKSCPDSKSLIDLEVSKDNGKTWIRDYDGSWMAKRDGSDGGLCKFSLGAGGSIWVESYCAI